MNKFDVQWQETLQAVLDFQTQYGRRPRTSGPDRGEEEKKLGNWLNTQRQCDNKANLLPERRVLLDRQLPLWADSRYLAWLKHLASLQTFVTENGRLPRTEGLHLSKDERSLNIWLAAQRKWEANGRLSLERRSKLDQCIPKWRGNDLGKATWRNKLTTFLHFQAEHGRRPRMEGPNATSEEKHLGLWLATQRQSDKKGKLSPERRALLDEHIPDWRDHYRAVWRANLVAVQQFQAEHGRRPRMEGPNATSEKKHLGLWLVTQRQSDKKGKLSPERRALLDERIPDWRGPRHRPSYDHIDQATLAANVIEYWEAHPDAA